MVLVEQECVCGFSVTDLWDLEWEGTVLQRNG